MKIKIIISLIAAFVVLQNESVRATPIIDRATGLVAPDTLIDFGDDLYLTGTVITDQFAADGVTFGDGADSNFRYTQSDFTDLSRNQGYLSSIITANDPGPIKFSFASGVTAVAMSWRTNEGVTTFGAYLNGTLVEEFTANTDLATGPTDGSYYGFEGITFDEIRISDVIPKDSKKDQAFNLDNLQYNVVPEPSTMLLLGSGLAGLGWYRRRRKREV